MVGKFIVAASEVNNFIVRLHIRARKALIERHKLSSGEKTSLFYMPFYFNCGN